MDWFLNSMDWFLYKMDIRHERVTPEEMGGKREAFNIF